MQQGKRDLVTYLTHFQRLTAEVPLPDITRATIFYQGLKEELKDKVAQVVPQPATCADLVELVLQMNQRMLERQWEKNRLGSPPLENYTSMESDKGARSGEAQSEPMQIGSIRRTLTEKEKERRRRFNLCLFCGKEGHYARMCPEKEKPRGTAENYWARR